MDADKTPQEKARWGEHKNVVSNTEQILEAACYEITDILLLTSHYENHPNKMN